MNLNKDNLGNILKKASSSSQPERSQLFRSLAQLIAKQEESRQGDTALLLDILDAFKGDVATNVRQEMAEELVELKRPPMELALKLAVDDIDVARPILTQLNFTDDELVSIINQTDKPHHLLIAERGKLTKPVWKALARKRMQNERQKFQPEPSKQDAITEEASVTELPAPTAKPVLSEATTLIENSEVAKDIPTFLLDKLQKSGLYHGTESDTDHLVEAILFDIEEESHADGYDTAKAANLATSVQEAAVDTTTQNRNVRDDVRDNDAPETHPVGLINPSIESQIESDFKSIRAMAEQMTQTARKPIATKTLKQERAARKKQALSEIAKAMQAEPETEAPHNANDAPAVNAPPSAETTMTPSVTTKPIAPSLVQSTPKSSLSAPTAEMAPTEHTIVTTIDPDLPEQKLFPNSPRAHKTLTHVQELIHLDDEKQDAHKPMPKSAAEGWAFRTDRHGQLDRLEGNTRRAFGNGAENLKGENFFGQLRDTQSTKPEEGLSALVDHHMPIRDMVIEINDPSGNPTPWKLRAKARFDPVHGRFIGYEGTATPIISGDPASGDAHFIDRRQNNLDTSLIQYLAQNSLDKSQEVLELANQMLELAQAGQNRPMQQLALSLLEKCYSHSQDLDTISSLHQAHNQERDNLESFSLAEALEPILDQDAIIEGEAARYYLNTGSVGISLKFNRAAFIKIISRMITAARYFGSHETDRLIEATPSLSGFIDIRLPLGHKQNLPWDDAQLLFDPHDSLRAKRPLGERAHMAHQAAFSLSAMQPLAALYGAKIRLRTTTSDEKEIVFSIKA